MVVLWPEFAWVQQLGYSGQEQLWGTYRLTGSIAGLFAVRWLLDRLIYRPTAKSALLKPQGQHVTSNPVKKQRDVERFCESFWKVTCYCTLLATGVYALHDQPWLWHTKNFWVQWPHHDIPTKVHAYYGSELVFYASSIFMLAFWEERRRDFPVMMLHHVTSVGLIILSHMSGFARVGSVIMLLHDPSDIFLEAAKMCNYIGWEGPSVVLFSLLLVTWFGLRLVVLPGWIIPSIWYELPAIVGKAQPQATGLSLMLCLLVLLHAYWFYLIASIAVNMLSGDLRDTRETED